MHDQIMFRCRFSHPDLKEMMPASGGMTWRRFRPNLEEILSAWAAMTWRPSSLDLKDMVSAWAAMQFLKETSCK